MTIRGGSVTIAGGISSGIGAGGTGIGGGAGFNSANGGAGGTVIITGGTVTVTGGNGGYGGAGIGGGASGSAGGTGGTVVILTSVQVTGGTGTGADGIDDGINIGGGQGNSQAGGDGKNGSGIRPSDSGNGTYEVYGNLQLPVDVEIPNGATLTIPDGSSLTVPDDTELVVDGTLEVKNGGSLSNSGTVSGSGELTGSGTVTNNDGTINVDNNHFAANVSLSINPNSATYGSTVTLTATVTSGDNQAVTGGTVYFYQGTDTTGTPLNSSGATVTNGTATYELSLNSNNWTPIDNPYTITAVYTPGQDSGLLSGSGTAQLTVTAVSYTVTIPASATAGGDEVSVTAKDFRIAVNGRVRVTVEEGAPEGVVTLARQNDTANDPVSITSRLQNGKEGSVLKKGDTVALYDSNAQLIINETTGKLYFTYPTPPDSMSRIPAGTYSGTVAFKISYEPPEASSAETTGQGEGVE